MASKDWLKAIKYLEKLEARYPYGRFAQQAQLEIAYCHWKDSERASAIAAVDRFIKMYPNHANADYAWYLKGLINFNDQYGILSQLTTPEGRRQLYSIANELDLDGAMALVEELSASPDDEDRQGILQKLSLRPEEQLRKAALRGLAA